MIQYHFQCRLLSDVVITSSPATEGFPQSLDYLPGTKFLGIASVLYDETNPEQTLDLFHNGKVSFGDAHPVLDGNRTLKMPLSWSVDKDKKPEDGKVYQHHSITDFAALAASGVQLKQLRSGYFQPKTGTYQSLGQTFRLKSAYDSSARRSQDEQMYGYHALTAGSIWQFAVYSADKPLLELVKPVLKGEKRIGRSRSAEYGLVDISFLKEEVLNSAAITEGSHYLYADSSICLPAGTGNLNELLPEGVTVDYEKSKIRTRLYQSWNRHRHSLNTDRQIVEKGSVIAIKVSTPMATGSFINGLGEGRSEGFGHVLVDPAFLQTKTGSHFISLPLKKAEGEQVKTKIIYPEHGKEQTELIACLLKRKNDTATRNSIDEAVNEFVKANKGKFLKVTASQWGTVRSLAKMFSNKNKLEYELFNELRNERGGYLVKGIAEEKWRVGKDIIRHEVLNQTTFSPDLYLQKIATEMAKLKRK